MSLFPSAQRKACQFISNANIRKLKSEESKGNYLGIWGFKKKKAMNFLFSFVSTYVPDLKLKKLATPKPQ